MGQPSFEASNALIYITYGVFLVIGTALAWKMRTQNKGEFLAGNRTQKGQEPNKTFHMAPADASKMEEHLIALAIMFYVAMLRAMMMIPLPRVFLHREPTDLFSTAIPIALNFIASALGSGILFSYPQLATLAGVQGVIVYSLASALPLMVFATLGPIIRRKCPEGFVLTEWTRQRYGVVAGLYLSFMTLVTLFLYMIAELSAVGQVVNALTGLDGLPVMIVQCAVTTIYTSLGGFKISFLTDVIQGAMVVLLITLATITIGATTKIDRSLIESSGYLEPSLLGWQLIYILPICILTNDFFLSSFWLRTFASRTDRDLRVGVSIATLVILVVLTLVGSTGLIATWSGAWPGDPPQDGAVAFFLLLAQLPGWVVGLVLVMVVSLSTAAFDSLQSAMVSSASNDLVRNRLNIWYIRLAVVLIIVPVIVLALKAPSILQIYLITDLVSSAAIPVLCLGLSDRFFYWIRGFEIVVGGLGGIFTVFLFGTVYYGNARDGANLILIQQGLTSGDWAVFGAFVAAPVGGLVWCFAAAGCRLGFQYFMARKSGKEFDGLARSVVGSGQQREGVRSGSGSDEHGEEQDDGQFDLEAHKNAGKFF